VDIAELGKRAESGGCAAQTTLGLLYLYGEEPFGIDYEKALRFLSMAAEQGASRAIANLGDMYLNGLGTAKDVNKAIELYRRVISTRRIVLR
jgi:TPR repeat protein